MKKIPFHHLLITTGLGSGLFPYGPGTMGALFGILIWYPTTLFLTYPVWLSLTLIFILTFTFVGAWSSSVAEKYWGEDPSRVVIDEVVGQWIALLAIPASFTCWHVLAAFVLFRFFDITKPLGIRKMENFKGGWGIMADDILAGCYSALILFIFSYVQW